MEISLLKIVFLLEAVISISNSRLHDTRGITPKRITSGGAHLRDLAPVQHSFEETSLQ